MRPLDGKLLTDNPRASQAIKVGIACDQGGTTTDGFYNADAHTAACIIRPQRPAILDPALEVSERQRRGEPSAIVDWYIETIPRVSVKLWSYHAT